MKNKFLKAAFGIVLIVAMMLAFVACNVDEKTQCKVKFDLGEGAVGTAPAEMTVDSGSEITLPAIGSVTKEGFNFKCWTAGGVEYPEGSKCPIVKDTTFAAKWVAKDDPSAEFTVTFSLGDYTEGVAPDPITAKAGTSITLPASVKREGYIFKGWFEGTIAYNAGAQYTVNGNVTLVAQYRQATPEDIAIVTFDVGPADEDHVILEGNGPDPIEAAIGEEITIPEVRQVRDGMYFVGWGLPGVAELYKPDQKYKVTESVTFTAVWKTVEEVTVYTVSFDLGNGVEGVPPQSRSAAEGMTIQLPYPGVDAPEGMHFDGWLAPADSTIYPAGAKYTVKGNVTLTAKWAEGEGVATPEDMKWLEGVFTVREDIMAGPVAVMSFIYTVTYIDDVIEVKMNLISQYTPQGPIDAGNTYTAYEYEHKIEDGVEYVEFEGQETQGGPHTYRIIRLENGNIRLEEPSKYEDEETGELIDAWLPVCGELVRQ